MIKEDRCPCRWLSGHSAGKCGIMLTTKALRGSRRLSSGRGERGHGGERRYKSIYILHLITNGFEEEFLTINSAISQYSPIM